MNKTSLLAAALVTAGVLTQANADQVIYLTGSTAFRSTVYTALTTAGAIFDAAPDTTIARGPGSGSGASYVAFHGTINSTPVWINCSWNGSLAGLASVANVSIDNDGGPLFGAPAYWLKTDGSVSGAITNNATSADLEASSHQGDVAFSDTSEDSALPAIKAVTLKPYGQVGVVTFTWVKNQNTGGAAGAAQTAWNNLHNLSTYQIQALFGAGALTADFFTGVPTDSGNYVYVVGRNKGSGTRANVLNDCTYGVNTPVTQFTIGGGIGFNADGTPSSPDGTLTLGYALDPAGITADNGYESGGSVAAALGVTGSTAQVDPINGGTGWLAVGYLGVSDAVKSGLTVANNWLTENGVMESNGAIESGAYSFWGYENLYGRPNITDGSFLDTVAKKVLSGTQAGLGGSVAANHDASIKLSLMNAVKNTDFSYPTHK